MSSGTVLVAVDALYESVVFTPERWNQQAFADWAASIASEVPDIDRESGRELRRAMRIAVKLRAFWSSPEAARQTREADWRARVDLAVGAPAWRPTLALARKEFENHPSEESFNEVRDRFRLVNNQPWLDGATYAEWADGAG